MHFCNNILVPPLAFSHLLFKIFILNNIKVLFSIKLKLQWLANTVRTPDLHSSLRRNKVKSCKAHWWFNKSSRKWKSTLVIRCMLILKTLIYEGIKDGWSNMAQSFVNCSLIIPGSGQTPSIYVVFVQLHELKFFFQFYK